VDTKATIDMAKKTLTLEEGLTIKFSHQAKSTSEQNPRLHPQNKTTDPSKATQQAKAGKEREKQASSRSPDPSIHEVPRSIFSFSKDTAWSFTVSTTLCNDGGIARVIRSHAGVEKRNDSYLGELDFFSKNGRQIVQMTPIQSPSNPSEDAARH